MYYAGQNDRGDDDLASTELELGPESAKAPRSAGLLTVDLGAAVKTAWKARCDALGLRPGPAVCGLVEAALVAPMGPVGSTPEASSGVSAAARAFARLAPRPDEGRKVSREIALTPSEDAAVRAASAARGLDYQPWVVAAVRGALTHTPTFGQAELEALTASNELLAGLVVDIAKWRREVAETALAERLDALESTVKAHVELASQTMAQGTRRWEIRV